MIPHWLTPCSHNTKKGLPCPQPAAYQIFEIDEEDGVEFVIRTCCHGHLKSKENDFHSYEKLPEMYATHCYSGDTWVTCEKHRGMFTMSSQKAPVKIHTAVGCEGCSVERDEY